MTPANYGSVFSCCLFSSLMMLYLYVFCRSKRFILRNGTFVIYLAVGVVMIRMLLPWNFHFAANVESHKILNVINLRKKISNSFRIDIFFLFWYAYIIKRNHEPASKKDVIIYETFSKSYIHGYTKNKI